MNERSVRGLLRDMRLVPPPPPCPPPPCPPPPSCLRSSGAGCGMSGAQPKAGNIAGVVSVTAEVDPTAAWKRHEQGWVDHVVEDVSELADKVRAATELVRERAPELKVEGPLQYDAAVNASVAASKMPGSEVAGQATVFVFPDLNTGNNTYKAVQQSSGAVAVGPVLQGLNKPVNDLSRGTTVEDIVNTVAITAIQAQAQG